MNAPIELSQKDGVASILFNRPEALNTLDLATGEAFQAAANAAVADPDTRVVLIRGRGRSFMAGGDLGGFHSASDPSAAVKSVIDPTHAALKTLAASNAITIAAGQGPIAGGGMSIFLGCDLGIATQSASFNLAYARIAAVPDCGGSWALPRLVGLRRAMAIALLCETIPAAEALTLGLVNRLVPDDELDTAAEALAGKIARGPAASQAHIKSLLRSSFERDYGAQLDAEEAAFVDAAADPDFAEGLAAFFEKRPADFGPGKR